MKQEIQVYHTSDGEALATIRFIDEPKVEYYSDTCFMHNTSFGFNLDDSHIMTLCLVELPYLTVIAYADSPNSRTYTIPLDLDCTFKMCLDFYNRLSNGVPMCEASQKYLKAIIQAFYYVASGGHNKLFLSDFKSEVDYLTFINSNLQNNKNYTVYTLKVQEAIKFVIVLKQESDTTYNIKVLDSTTYEWLSDYYSICSGDGDFLTECLSQCNNQKVLNTLLQELFLKGHYSLAIDFTPRNRIVASAIASVLSDSSYISGYSKSIILSILKRY